MLFLFDTMFTTMGLIVNNLSAEMAISSSARAKIAGFAFIACFTVRFTFYFSHFFSCGIVAHTIGGLWQEK